MKFFKFWTLFWIFWEFSQNCLTQANFNLSSWNFVRKCTNTECGLILHFVRIGQDVQILDEFEFFLSWHHILKIRCTHEASSVRKLKSSNVLPQRKNFVELVRKQYGNPDSHDFLLLPHWGTNKMWVYGILNLKKNGRGSSQFHIILVIILTLHTDILYWSRNFGIEFGPNRLKRSNFFRFWIFWEFS